MTLRRIVLASTSPYRHELLERLGIAFEVARPEVDEAALTGESPDALAIRLAEAKGRAVASHYPGALIIGSDQVADLDGRQLHKPGNRDNAIDQLTAASGRRVRFITAVCVVDAATGAAATRSVETLVTFRLLDRALIERYVDREQPFDCAGSAKAEGLGIALIERIASTDPTALIGLPLIAVTDLLAACGVRIP